MKRFLPFAVVLACALPAAAEQPADCCTTSAADIQAALDSWGDDVLGRGVGDVHVSGEPQCPPAGMRGRIPKAVRAEGTCVTELAGQVPPNGRLFALRGASAWCGPLQSLPLTEDFARAIEPAGRKVGASAQWQHFKDWLRLVARASGGEAGRECTTHETMTGEVRIKKENLRYTLFVDVQPDGTWAYPRAVATPLRPDSSD